MNHIALVTGAAQGLGYTLCARLLEAGYKVVVTDRSLEAATAAAGQLDDTGESTVAIKLDVTCKADFAAALAQVLEQWGRCTCWSTMRRSP